MWLTIGFAKLVGVLESSKTDAAQYTHRTRPERQIRFTDANYLIAVRGIDAAEARMADFE